MRTERRTSHEVREADTRRQALLQQLHYAGLVSARYNVDGLSTEALRELAQMRPRQHAELQGSSALALNAQVELAARQNGFVEQIFERASERPAKIAVAARNSLYKSGTGHERTEDALRVANHRGFVKADLITSDSVSDAEREHWVNVLAKTFDARAEQKIEEAHARFAELQLQQQEWLGQGTAEDSPAAYLALAHQLQQLEASIVRLENQHLGCDYDVVAGQRLNGLDAALYLAVLKTIHEDYDGVVGGGDCPSKDFILALAQSNPIRTGPLFSTYIMTGPSPATYPANFISQRGREHNIATVLAITDPALEPNPSPAARAFAAYHTGLALQRLAPQVPVNIGFMSYSTGPSGGGDLVELNRQAYEEYQTLDSAGKFAAFGPMQADAALNAAIAADKADAFERAVQAGKLDPAELEAYKAVAGQVSVLSFANLDGANTATKLMFGSWEQALEMGPIILPDSRLVKADGTLFNALDLSRGDTSLSILLSLAGVSVLSQTH